jgi:uncharacterized membrane protein YhdT
MDERSNQSSSYIVTNYISNTTSDDKEKRCFKAPPGYMIESSFPATLSKVTQLIQLLYIGISDWQYAGTVKNGILFPSDSEERGDAYVDLFIKPTKINPIVVGAWANRGSKKNSDDVGKPVYYEMHYNGLFVKSYIWTFSENVRKRDVDPASISTPCEYLNEEDSPDVLETCMGRTRGKANELARNIKDLLKKRATGAKIEKGNRCKGSSNQKCKKKNRLLQNDDKYPSARITYQMTGYESEWNMESFDPPMASPPRPFLPIQSQGNCASCWAVAATHSISSVYIQAYSQPGNQPGITRFSHQHAMNCLAKEVLYFELGCFGGFETDVFDWLKYNKGMMPTYTDVPYIAFQGGCKTDPQILVDTGITAYSYLNGADQIKNALYYRGDVAVSVSSKGLLSFNPDRSVIFPTNNDNKVANLGMGISMHASIEELDHSVVIVGWAPCAVKSCNNTGPSEIDDSAECWIVQNSWGTNAGWNGYYFVHTEPGCDLGISFDGNAHVAMGMTNFYD